MAAAVDSFSLLYREVSRCVSRWFEPLVVVGALYVCGRVLVLLRGTCTMLRVHVLPRVCARGPPLSQRYGAWAVLNGASSEVCRAYAEELARRGLNILLISQSGVEGVAVEEAGSEALRRHGVEVELLQVDFTLLGGGGGGGGASASKHLHLALKDKDIGMLVNCLDPQLDTHTDLVDQSEEALLRALGANMAAASLLTRWVLPGMVERHRGALVNISSGTHCCPPVAGRVMLAASCGYMDQFSRALRQEYGRHGIFVQSLIPLEISSSGDPGWLAPTAELYARHAVTTLGISNHTTGYWLHALQYGAMRCVPEWIWMLTSRLFLTLT